MQRFTDLAVWQRARRLVQTVYKHTSQFPSAEMFGLTGQMRRAAVSVVANIAEGTKRATRREFARFLNIAQGSLAELHCLFMVAHDLRYLDDVAPMVDEVDQIGRMLSRLRSRVLAPRTGHRLTTQNS